MKDLVEEVKLEGLEGDYPKPILLEDLGSMYATEKSKSKSKFGIYRCGFCGTEFKARTDSIKSKNTKSCGCYNKRITGELNKTHGLGYTRLYRIWINMKDRVFNTNSDRYKYYGDRGITICDDWLDVQNFYDWAMLNGYEENKGLSIDRIDNNGNYEPSNCRWTTKTIQARNQRIQKNNTSGYRGVSFYKNYKMFVVKINVNKKKIHLGYFHSAVEAGIAYNNYIIENNLEGYNLNEIPEVQKC